MGARAGRAMPLSPLRPLLGRFPIGLLPITPAQFTFDAVPSTTNILSAISIGIYPPEFTLAEADHEFPMMIDTILEYYMNDPGEMLLGASNPQVAKGAILSSLTNALGNILLTHAFSGTLYISLHTGNPGVLGDPGSECAGGSYARQGTTWTPPSNKTTANKLKCMFPNMPPCTVTHVGIWSTLVGGQMYAWCQFAAPIAVASGQEFHIPISDLVVTL